MDCFAFSEADHEDADDAENMALVFECVADFLHCTVTGCMYAQQQ
eukprot:CAMPEP_0117610900 /NCGR_PEP_ID=MMETSP0784-20121206/82112_1 /TAXON_ID=39447 /ORGANISM="" /LENGTH=44 /DNA_ID= /DNA_START= /DNA_END= /DNA_ORIENTATION=